MTFSTTFPPGILAPATPRLRPRSTRRWATLSVLVTASVVVTATVIGVDVGASGAATTPIPQSIAAPPAATTLVTDPTAGRGDGGPGAQGRGAQGGDPGGGRR